MYSPISSSGASAPEFFLRSGSYSPGAVAVQRDIDVHCAGIAPLARSAQVECVGSGNGPRQKGGGHRCGRVLRVCLGHVQIQRAAESAPIGSGRALLRRIRPARHGRARNALLGADGVKFPGIALLQSGLVVLACLALGKLILEFLFFFFGKQLRPEAALFFFTAAALTQRRVVDHGGCEEIAETVVYFAEQIVSGNGGGLLLFLRRLGAAPEHRLPRRAQHGFTRGTVQRIFRLAACLFHNARAFLRLLLRLGLGIRLNVRQLHRGHFVLNKRGLRFRLRRGFRRFLGSGLGNLRQRIVFFVGKLRHRQQDRLYRSALFSGPDAQFG